MNEANLKEKIAREFRQYLMLVLFLTLFSFALSAYTRLVAGQYPFSAIHYGYGFIESLILAKIILLGEHFKLGERYGDRPLFVPTLYKTFVFCLFVFLFGILEHFVIGTLHGKPFHALYLELISNSWMTVIGKVLVKFFAFILLFAFTETGSVIGEDKLFDLFFRRNKL